MILYAIVVKTLSKEIQVDSVHHDRVQAELRWNELNASEKYKRVYLREVNEEFCDKAAEEEQWVVLLIQKSKTRNESRSRVGPFSCREDAEMVAREEVWNNVFADEEDEAHVFQLET